MKNSKKPAKKSSKSSNAQIKKILTPESESLNDLRSAVLVISLLVNLFVLCIWITLQITSQYDTVLFDFFVNR